MNVTRALVCGLSGWFKHILLARTVDIIKQMLTILKLQGLEWKQHAYIIPFLLSGSRAVCPFLMRSAYYGYPLCIR